ncbi:MAG: RHS repeat-associated core domain-containing protein, partial [Chitinophagaceae bacterium]|nr:RHS repeat-associated core domain-containing protein [Chitinophagaceae bacterium]
MNDVTGTTGYNFDVATGALTGVVYPDLKTISYDYDAAGNRVAMKDPFGFNTYYQFDQRNRLDTVASSLDFSNDYDVKYQYYNNNLLKQSKQGNGVTSDYKYDGLQIGELIEKKSNGTVINSYSYVPDKNGNQLQKKENGTPHSFVYDELNRVTNSNQFNETYGYDSRGNRNSLTTIRPFESPVTGYGYDKRDRLTSVTVDGKTVSYKYNGDGLLWERTENGQTTRYYWDADQVIAEATVSGGTTTLKARYVRGKNLVAREDEQGKAYYLQNGHGDVVELRDKSGDTSLNQYSYDIFGNIVSESEMIPQPFKYSGEMTDSTTNLQYLRARWYDPSIGRFINEDTYQGQIDNPLSLNLYTYVHNNPLINNDPTGHWCTSADGKYSHAGGCNGGKEGISAKNNLGGAIWTPDFLHVGEKEIDKGKQVGAAKTAKDLDMTEFWSTGAVMQYTPTAPNVVSHPILDAGVEWGTGLGVIIGAGPVGGTAKVTITSECYIWSGCDVEKQTLTTELIVKASVFPAGIGGGASSSKYLYGDQIPGS